jgi:uncharacterized protein
MLRGLYSHLGFTGRLMLLLILVFSCLLFASLLSILMLVPFLGSGVTGIIAHPDYTQPGVVNALKFIQIINMAGGLLLPAWLFQFLTTPASESQTLWKRLPSVLFPIVAVLAILAVQPLVGWLGEVNCKLSLPAVLAPLENWMQQQEKTGELLTDAFLATTTAGGLLTNILMIAVLPALAEEYLFRGILARLLNEKFRSMHIAVIVSALIFAAIHLQFYGFLPRFLLGVVLGYLYFISGSLWLPVIAHFTNNFLTIIIEFLFRKGIVSAGASDFGVNSPAGILLLSVAITTVLMIGLSRRMKKADIRADSGPAGA